MRNVLNSDLIFISLCINQTAMKNTIQSTVPFNNYKNHIIYQHSNTEFEICDNENAFLFYSKSLNSAKLRIRKLAFK